MQFTVSIFTDIFSSYTTCTCSRAVIQTHTHTHTNMITNHRAKDRCMCVINSPAVRTQRAVCTVKFVKSFATWQHRFDVDSKFLSHPAPLSPVFENTYFTFFKIQKNAFFTFSWNDMSKKNVENVIKVSEWLLYWLFETWSRRIQKVSTFRNVNKKLSRCLSNR